MLALLASGFWHRWRCLGWRPANHGRRPCLSPHLLVDSMNGSWLERLARWICGKFGHSGMIEYDPGGGDPEICWRCRTLLSTAYSRERDKK